MSETRKHTQLGFSVIVMRGTGPMARAALEAIGLPSMSRSS